MSAGVIAVWGVESLSHLRGVRATAALHRARANRQELETQGSGGAPQPAESTADASQLGGLPTVRLKLGCFNCGIDQYMLSKIAHRKSLSRVIAKGVDKQDLHILTLSEVGGRERSETGDAP